MVFLGKVTYCTPERCSEKLYLTILRRFRMAMVKVLSIIKVVSSIMSARK